MFRSFIYLDEDKLDTYKRQLNKANTGRPTGRTQKKTAGFSANVVGLGVTGTTETALESEYEKDIEFDYDCFELALEKLDGEDYFDCALNSEYDLTTVLPMKIIRVCNGFIVPEEFDFVNMIERFKPMLLSQIETSSNSEQEALENVFGTTPADIPIIVENNDITISGKLNTKYLREDYSTLEDYSEQDVYLLCKVVGTVRKENVVIFDPLKDFIRLPRSIRRKTKSSENEIGLEKIAVEALYLRLK